FYSRIEARGIRQDQEVKKNLERKYQKRREGLEEELIALTEGLEVNANSPKQIHNLLYGILGIPLRKDTGEETLEALLRNVVKDRTKRRIIELILEIRKVRKTLGTYINAEAFPDRRIRTGIRIMLETGRTSTSVLEPPVTTSTFG